MSRRDVELDMMKVLDGICPYCDREVRDWSAPTGYFAPEAYAALREQGIDPATGHRKDCSRPKALSKDSRYREDRDARP